MKLIRLMILGVVAFSASNVFADAGALPNCDLQKFQNDAAITSTITIKPDPSGLALEGKQGADVANVLQTYAKTNNCQLYVLSFFDLASGLLKGSEIGNIGANAGGNNEAANPATTQLDNMRNNYILINNVDCGSLLNCMKVMNIQLPVKTIAPEVAPAASDAATAPKTPVPANA